MLRCGSGSNGGGEVDEGVGRNKVEREKVRGACVDVDQWQRLVDNKDERGSRSQVQV